MQVVVTNGVLREKPAKNGKNLGRVDSGTYEVTDTRATEGGSTWFQIEGGWISSDDDVQIADETPETPSPESSDNEEEGSTNVDQPETPSENSADSTSTSDTDSSNSEDANSEDNVDSPESNDGAAGTSPASDPEPNVTPANISEYKVGYTVQVKPGAKHYSSSSAASGANVKAGLAVIQDVDPREAHPLKVRAVNGSGCYLTTGVNGWVDIEDVELMKVKFPKKSY